MTGVLIDSDWMIDLLNGQPRARRLIDQLADRPVAISVLTVGEILEGLVGRDDAVQAEDRFREAIGGVEQLGLDYETVRYFALLRADLRSRGQLIADLDLLIAATAIRHDLALVTRNYRHFTRIEALRLYPDDPSSSSAP